MKVNFVLSNEDAEPGGEDLDEGSAAADELTALGQHSNDEDEDCVEVRSGAGDEGGPEIDIEDTVTHLEETHIEVN